MGILTNRAAADFDNIIAGPAPFATIYSDDFSEATPAFGGWTTTEGSWQRTGGLVHQSSTAGDTRLTVGAGTDDPECRYAFGRPASPRLTTGLACCSAIRTFAITPI